MENKLFSPGTDISRSITCPSVSGLSFDAPAQVDTCEQPVPCVKGSAIFPCSLDQGRGKTHWNASIYILFCSPHMCEAVAEGRSTTFHFIVGHHRDGNFLCVPSHGFGCELSRLSDTFWNSERIREHLCPVDSATLVAAVACLDTLWPYAHSRERRHYV